MKYTLAAFGLCTAIAGSAAVARSEPPAAAPIVVHIANFAFVPAKLMIGAEQTVRFVNDDGEAHTVTARDATFDSKGLDTHDAWQHTFVHAGTFVYYCQLHPMMIGTIVVRPAGTQP